LLRDLKLAASLPDGRERRDALVAIKRSIEQDYCAKVGVTDDDIAFCTYFQVGTCGYHNALTAIHEDYGINLITYEVSEC